MIKQTIKCFSLAFLLAAQNQMTFAQNVWKGSWATAVEWTGKGDMPKESLSNRSCRQVVPRIFEDGTGDADTLALATGKSAASVSDICIETFLRLGDELVSIGNLSCIGYFLVCSIGLAESDVILEACIEE